MKKFRQLASIVTASSSLLLLQLLAAISIPPNTASNQTFFSKEIIAPAQAGQTAVTYRPPNRGAPRSTQGTGSRGCPETGPIGLSLVAPQDHTGLSASGHPTFLLHVSQVPTGPLELTLTQPGVAQPLFVKQTKVTQAGIVEVKTPAQMPELVEGQKYQWSVSLVCNEKRRSTDVFAQAWVQRVKLSPEVEQKLGTAKTETEKAQIYAAAGLWYDSVSTLYQASANQLGNTEIVTAWSSLLEQGGLQKDVAQDQNRLTVQ